MEATAESIKKELSNNIAKFDQLDSTVVEYIVSVLTALTRERGHQEGAGGQHDNDSSSSEEEDRTNLASMLTAHGAYEDEEEAKKAVSKVFLLLNLGESSSDTTPPESREGDLSVRTLDRPVLLK